MSRVTTDKGAKLYVEVRTGLYFDGHPIIVDRVVLTMEGHSTTMSALEAETLARKIWVHASEARRRQKVRFGESIHGGQGTRMPVEKWDLEE